MAARPWWAEPWPWVLIALPAVSVAVGIVALVLSLRGADALVGDDWYKRGLAVNQDLARAAEAARLNLAATVELDAEAREVVVALDGDVGVDTLALALAHPTLAARDQLVVLARSARTTSYRARVGAVGQSDQMPVGRWYATLEPPSGLWRLAAPITLTPGIPVRLEPTL